MSVRLLHFLCLVSLALVAPAASRAAGKTIVFFGDSLTAGYGLDDPLGESYPGVIEKKLAQSGAAHRVVNAGLSGETSAGGLRRVDWILRQKIDVFFLALGANDGLRGIEPALTKKNLQAIIDRVRAKYPNAVIVIAGMMMPRSMGENYAQEFGAIFPDLARENNLTLMPFLLEGVGGVPALNQPDTIHPNAEGHQKVADAVWPYIEPLL